MVLFLLVLGLLVLLVLVAAAFFVIGIEAQRYSTAAHEIELRGVREELDIDRAAVEAKRAILEVVADAVAEVHAGRTREAWL